MVYDIIIVGGSAIGLFLAKEFASQGKSVLVLERNKKIGQKACSGLLSFNVFNYFSEKELEGLIERKIKGANLWIEDQPLFFKGKALVINRRSFDNYLFQKALGKGALVLLDKEVISFKEKNRLVEVLLRSGEVFKGKILAGCDGVNSTVAQEANFPVQKKKVFGVFTFENKSPEKNDNFVDLFFSKKFPGFFAWRIPREEKIEWGLALNQKQRPLEKLKKFLKKKNISFSFFQGAYIPSFPLKKTAKGRIFLCGDSAGQIKPYTGGGLIYGFECAKIAAKTITNFKNPNLQDYEKLWRKTLKKDILVGNFLRRCYFLPNFVKKTGLFLLQKRKNIDQDKPSSIF